MKITRYEIRKNGLKNLDVDWLKELFYPKLSKKDGITYSNVIIMDRKEIVENLLKVHKDLENYYTNKYSKYFDGINEKMSKDTVYQNLKSIYDNAKFISESVNPNHIKILQLGINDLEYLKASCLYTFICELLKTDPTNWKTCDIKRFAGAYNALRNKVCIKHMENFINYILRILYSTNTTVKIYSNIETMVKDYAKKEFETNKIKQEKLKKREEVLNNYINYSTITENSFDYGRKLSVTFNIDERVKKLKKLLKK